MTLRFVPNTYTLDEQRQEINNLASDVNAIDTAFDERVDDRLSALLSGGTGISAVYNDNANSLSLSIDFTEFNTDSLVEGTSKLFFTQSRARQSFSIAAEPAASGNGALAYDNSTGIFTYTPPALTLADITANGNTTTTDITVGGLSVNTNNLNAANNIYITTANKEFGFYEGGKIAVVDTATPGLGALTLVHRDVNGEETLAKFTRDSGAELYYDGSKKLETTLTGVTVTGGVSSSTLRIGSGPGNTATVEIDGTIRSSTHTFTVGSIIQFSTAGGTADVTLIGNDSITTGSLTAQSGVNVSTGQAYKINNVNVLTATALGSGVTSSSLTSVGTLTSLTVTGVITANGRIDASASGILFDTGSYTGSDEPIKLWIGNSGGAKYFTLLRSNGGQVILNNAHPTGQNDHRASTHSFTQTGSEYYALFNNGTVKLYHPASANGILDQKFETTASGIKVSGTNINLSTSNTPASATATGTAGDIRWDADYIYVCVAANTWKRSAISTWT